MDEKTTAKIKLLYEKERVDLYSILDIIQESFTETKETDEDLYDKIMNYLERELNEISLDDSEEGIGLINSLIRFYITYYILRKEFNETMKKVVYITKDNDIIRNELYLLGMRETQCEAYIKEYIPSSKEKE